HSPSVFARLACVCVPARYLCLRSIRDKSDRIPPVAAGLQQDDDLEQAIHIRSCGFNQLLHVIHDDADLPFERQVREGRYRQTLGASVAQLRSVAFIEWRKARDENEVAVLHAKIERPGCFWNVSLDHLLVHDSVPSFVGCTAYRSTAPGDEQCDRTGTVIDKRSPT